MNLKVSIAGVVLLAFHATAQNIPDILWTTNAHGFAVTSVSFSGDSMSLASGSSDSTVQVRTVANAQLTRVFLNPGGAVLAVALSSNGSFVAAGDGDGKTRMWRMSDGAQLWIGGPNNQLVFSLAFSPDDSLVAISRSDGINVRHAITGMGIPFNEPEGDVYQLTFSPDGRLLASANANRVASLWRVPEGTLLVDLNGHSNAVTAVDFSPDGTLLATASADGTARLWNLIDGSEPRVIQGGGGNVAKFSADGKLLFTVNSGAIKVWRAADSQLLYDYGNAGAGPLDVASNGKYFGYGRSDGVIVLAHMPLLFEETRQNGQIILNWTGGSGIYRIQRRNDLTRGVWHNFGPPTTALSFTNKLTREPISYRVISLPNP